MIIKIRNLGALGKFPIEYLKNHNKAQLTATFEIYPEYQPNLDIARPYPI